MIRLLRRVTIASFAAAAAAVLALAALHLLTGGTIRSLLASPVPNGDPVIGVDYRVTLQCAIPFAVGDTTWDFVDHPPWPESSGIWIFEDVGTPHSVAGVVRLFSPTSGVVVLTGLDPVPIRRVPADAAGGTCL